MLLTKSDIAEHIREQTNLNLKQSAHASDCLLEIITSALESGDDVLVSGFGKFCVKEKVQRMGRNPATGQGMTIPARRTVMFKCSQKLRERVSER